MSIGWLLVSLWPHSCMHVYNGEDTHRLSCIEYGCHVTLLVAGVILDYSFLVVLWADETNKEAAAPPRVR